MPALEHSILKLVQYTLWIVLYTRWHMLLLRSDWSASVCSHNLLLNTLHDPSQNKPKGLSSPRWYIRQHYPAGRPYCQLFACEGALSNAKWAVQVHHPTAADKKKTRWKDGQVYVVWYGTYQVQALNKEQIECWNQRAVPEARRLDLKEAVQQAARAVSEGAQI